MEAGDVGQSREVVGQSSSSPLHSQRAAAETSRVGLEEEVR